MYLVLYNAYGHVNVYSHDSNTLFGETKSELTLAGWKERLQLQWRRPVEVVFWRVLESRKNSLRLILQAGVSH